MDVRNVSLNYEKREKYKFFVWSVVVIISEFSYLLWRLYNFESKSDKFNISKLNLLINELTSIR